MPDPNDPRPEPAAHAVQRITVRLAGRRDPAECNPLPANCPFAKRLPKGRDQIADAIEDGSIPCCRMERPFWLDRSEPPLCRVEGEEVYRFLYMQAFGAHASIRIAKRRDEIIVERSYYPGMFNKPERFAALLTEADWDRLQDAVTVARFWWLPRIVRPRGLWLDGFHLIVEARRGDTFRVSKFDNPDVPEFWKLGRLAFDLAGLDDVPL
jgi:hypothetical protein